MRIFKKYVFMLGRDFDPRSSHLPVEVRDHLHGLLPAAGLDTISGDLTCEEWITAATTKPNVMQLKALLGRIGIAPPAPPASRQDYFERLMNCKVCCEAR